MSEAARRRSEPGEAQATRHAGLCDVARTLAPAFEARAAATEAARRLPEETLDDLHRSGLFRMLQPMRVGGAELDYSALVEIGAIVAQGCASTAWTLTNLASHHWMLAMFPEAAQGRVWGESPDALIASSFIFPAGKARAVDAGYRLTGRWPFSSGVDHSQWNMLTGIVAAENGGAPDYRVFLLPESDYEVLDTWRTGGLRGTGSNDVVCEDVFVPGEMTVAADAIKGGPTPGSAVNPNPLYRLPVLGLFPLVLSGVALGIAEACLAAYLRSSRGRASKFTGADLAGLQSTQIRIGNAGARIDVARRAMLGICEEATREAQAGRFPDLEAKMRYRRDVALAANLCLEAVDMVRAGSGAQALYESDPLERRIRDANAVAAHIAFSMDAAASAHGRVALGIDVAHPTV